MRVPAALFVAVALFGCKQAPQQEAAFVPPPPTPPAQHAAACVRKPEKEAFAVANLKSLLMVTAKTCQAEENYNAFITRYRTDLVRDEGTLRAYFGRAYGRRGQTEQDNFITELANAQSSHRVKYGQFYCPTNLGMFEEVMKLPNATELPNYAAGKPIQQALAIQDCPDTPPPSAKPAPAKKKAK